MKKIKLTLRIRKGLEERDFEEYEFDNDHFTEMFRVKDLSVFKDDSYVVGFITEVEDEELTAN